VTNAIVNDNKYGMEFYSDSYGVITVTDNIVSNNLSEGIDAYSNIGTITVTGNTISGNPVGIYASSSSGGIITVTDNTIVGNGYGMEISNSSSGPITISRNIINDSTDWVGVYVYSESGEVTLADNTMVEMCRGLNSRQQGSLTLKTMSSK
jgi:parallel beta-helix repeat protein